MSKACSSVILNGPSWRGLGLAFGFHSVFLLKQIDTQFNGGEKKHVNADQSCVQVPNS